MDSFWPIILFAIISIIIDRLDSKKKPPARRPQVPTDVQQEQAGPPKKIKFEIPTLANEPPKKGPNVVYREHESVDIEQMLAEQEAEARRRQQDLERRRREVAARKAEAERYAHEAKIPDHACAAPSTRHPLFTKLTPQTARDAIVLAEIIGKPKAYRHSRH